MTQPKDHLPSDLRALAEKRLETILSRARGDFQVAVRIAYLEAGRNMTTFDGATLALQREAAGAGELTRRAQLVWATYSEVFTRAGIEDPVPLLRVVLSEIPAILAAQKQDIFLTNRETFALAGGSITFDHLDSAVRQVLEDLEHALSLQALQSRELTATSLVALSAPRYRSAHAHWEKMKRLRAADDPDTENAVKEAMLAVEGLAKTILNRPAATLSDCLKESRLTNELSPTIVALLHKLYAFTNTSPGIRHASTTPPDTAAAEAAFAIETCAAALRLLLAVDSRVSAAG